jgi:Tfp pilus assembly protein PilO
MTLQDRDRRALALLAVAVIISLGVYLWPESAPAAVAPTLADSIAMAERRLQKTLELAATIPAKEKVLEQIDAQLKQREQGLIEADTPQQAQAQIVELLRKIARSQAPPLELGSIDLGPIQPFGDHYAEAFVSVSALCRIEQIVNLLADLSAQPELIATHDIQLRAGDQKKKTIALRLTVSGLLPRRLLPERKGAPPL